MHLFRFRVSGNYHTSLMYEGGIRLQLDRQKAIKYYNRNIKIKPYIYTQCMPHLLCIGFFATKVLANYKNNDNNNNNVLYYGDISY